MISTWFDKKKSNEVKGRQEDKKEDVTEVEAEEEKLHSLVASAVSPVDGAVDHYHGREHQ